jgi:hypothetical protein
MAEPRNDPTKNDSEALSEKNRLPFEPAGNRKKQPKQPPAPVPTAKAVAQTDRESMAIPQVVSQRMARRMAFFCGIPSALGMATFVVSYFIVRNEILALPNVVVVLVSMGFFGLGVLGLSYGVISASWDEERLGSWVGWSEFTLNWGRLTAAWRSNGKKSS